MARCPELEMGKNSATPCTRPSRKEEKAFIFHILLSFQITFCLFLSDYSDLYSFKKYGYIYTIAHSGGNYQCNLRPGEKFAPRGKDFPGAGGPQKKGGRRRPPRSLSEQKDAPPDGADDRYDQPQQEHDAPGQVRGLELFRVVIEKAQQEFVQGDGGLQQQGEHQAQQ